MDQIRIDDLLTRFVNGLTRHDPFIITFFIESIRTQHETTYCYPTCKEITQKRPSPASKPAQRVPTFSHIRLTQSVP